MSSTISPFPPSFEGNPWSYGFALTALMLVSALSLGRLLALAHDATRCQTLMQKLNLANVPDVPLPFWTPLVLYRLKIAGLYMTILFGATPDVFVLLCWGEASAPVMEHLFAIDRAFDAVLLLPFLTAELIGAWSNQAIPQQLARPPLIEIRPPRLDRVRETLKTGAVILTIAVMVTLGKAAA